MAGPRVIIDRPIAEGRLLLHRVVADAMHAALVPPEERGVGVVFQDYALFLHVFCGGQQRRSTHRMGVVCLLGNFFPIFLGAVGAVGAVAVAVAAPAAAMEASPC